MLTSQVHTQANSCGCSWQGPGDSQEWQYSHGILRYKNVVLSSGQGTILLFLRDGGFKNLAMKCFPKMHALKTSSPEQYSEKYSFQQVLDHATDD